MFNYAPFHRQAIFLILLLPAFLFVNSCNLLGGDDKSTSTIQWEEEDLSEYVLYAFTPFIDFLTVIDVQTGEILKTLEDLDGIQSVVTNNDGSQLFVSTGTQPSGADPGQIIRIDTQTWEREIIFEHAAELLSNANGDIYFITKHIDPEIGPVIPERVLGRIDPMLGSITLIDTLDVEWGSIYDAYNIEVSANTPEIFAVNSNGKLFRYDHVTSEKTYLFEGISFSQIAARIHLSHDGNFLLIPGGPVLDLINEKITGSVPTWWLGTAALRRDMKEVYITDPGGYLRDPLPSGNITIYNPSKNKVTGYIKIEVDDPYYHPAADRLTDMILLTENERYAIVSDWMRSYFVIDLKKRKAIHFSTYTPDEYPTLAIQKIFLSKKPPGL